jgi:hypothetical protein
MTAVAINREKADDMMEYDMIEVKRLYIVDDGASDLDMMLVSLMLRPNYRVVKVRCGNREVNDVREAYYNNCVIDEVELEVSNDTLDGVIEDLHFIDTMEKVEMFNMIFIVEIDDGYVELDIKDIRKFIWEEFIEELEE